MTDNTNTKQATRHKSQGTRHKAQDASPEQLLGNAKVFLRKDRVAMYERAVPKVHWFQTQRE
jgi:hypothetical protein